MKRRKPSEAARAEAMLVERLWLITLPGWVELNKAVDKLKEKQEAGALVLSRNSVGPGAPLKQKIKAGKLKVKGDPDWLANRLIRPARLGPRQAMLLRRSFRDMLPDYARANWLEADGSLKASFLDRGIIEQIKVELSLLGGFSLWERQQGLTGPNWRRKAKGVKATLESRVSRLPKVTLTGVNLPDPQRLELIQSLPVAICRKLMGLSPAGLLASRSLDMARDKAVEDHLEQAQKFKDEAIAADKKKRKID